MTEGEAPAAKKNEDAEMRLFSLKDTEYGAEDRDFLQDLPVYVLTSGIKRMYSCMHNAAAQGILRPDHQAKDPPKQAE